MTSATVLRPGVSTARYDWHMESVLPRSAMRRIGRAHGARRMRLFGSVARGDDTGSSDVDVLVRLEADRDLLDLVAIRLELEALLGRSVDVVDEGGLSPYLRESILRDARPL